jgi:VWFA-related protein
VKSRLRPIDHLAVLTFSALVQRNVDWSSDTAAAHAAIDRLSGSSRTSLYDALSIAISLQASSPPGRMHVLLVTDGFDTSSWLSPLVPIFQVRHSDLVVHVVRLGFSSRFASPTDILGNRDRRALFLAQPELAPAELLPIVAEDTGGELVDAETHASVEAICARLVESFRSRYVLTYSPTCFAPHGWHPLTVSVKNHRGNVVARRGYDR